MGYSQELLVLDAENNSPLEAVAIFSDDLMRNTLTDENGVATLENFSKGETLTIQYYGYKIEKFNFTHM